MVDRISKSSSRSMKKRRVLQILVGSLTNTTLPSSDDGERESPSLTSPTKTGHCGVDAESDTLFSSGQDLSVAAACDIVRQKRLLENEEEKVEEKLKKLQTSFVHIHNEMDAKITEIVRFQCQRRRVESYMLDMLRDGLDATDGLQRAEKEGGIAEGTVYDPFTNEVQSDWDYLGLGQYVNTSFPINKSSL